MLLNPVQVFFNGARLPVKSFQDYVALYLRDPDAPRVYERVSDRWEVCVTAAEGQFQQVGRAPGALRRVPRLLLLLYATCRHAQFTSCARARA